MIARLARLVAIRSLSGHESEIAAAVRQELEQAGLGVRREGNNVWCELGDAPRPRLLFNSHLDTVPPCDSWTQDPWVPSLEAGKLVGLGANDAKGCVSAMMEAALAAWRDLQAGLPLGGTLVLALTAEEETSGAGLGTILGHVAPLDAAIVGEPTGLVPMIAQRGLLILRGTVRARGGHPANVPADAVHNAILRATRLLGRLERFEWGPSHPLLGRCHAHVTTISGGVARNVVPDTCEFTLDIRTTPAESHASLVARLRAALDGDLHVHSDRLVPVQTNPSEPVVQAVLRALPGVQPAGSPTMSDMVFLRDVPTVKIGPGQSERSHTPDEYILLDELAAGAAAYRRILRAYFSLAGSASEVQAQNAFEENRP